ncbi:MAG: ATP-binding protein [Deltaproteobacteria bacterium]|nr:ATP-binding protein [Deltaproteobacteria bacterium]
MVRYNGRALGVAGTGIDLSRFIAAVINDSQSGISNLFVDSSGAIQTHKDAKEIDFRSISKQAGEKKTIYNMIDDPVERSSLKEAIDELKSGESEVKTLVLKINGRDYMVALAYISQIGWFNITLMEMGSWTSDEIFTPVGILLVLALILLAVISLFLVKFIVLDRITRLEKSSREVTQGNFDIELVDESPDEIGRLNRSFVEMTGEIRANTNGLEEKIAARTVELKQANESKDRLFTILAHDLKGPIGNLATLFNDLSEELDFNSPDLISSIRSSTQSTYDLLESLLLWAQCQSGNFEFMPRKIPLKETAEKTLKLFELQARSKKIKFSLEVGEDLYVTADEAMLKTVFRNLINNAVKYSYEGGEITLKADRRNDLLEISVTDQGMGIPADILSGLFELNSLSPSRRGTSNEIGTGLGLVLCKDLIGISGGRIGVESKSEKGSRFWFTLPIG